MTLARRQLLQLGGAAVALASSWAARAQTYPTQPVRLVVPYPAGGAIDIITRLLAHWLSGRLGQTFIVENRPGANGNIGTEAVVHASADGYTLLLVTAANAINATVYKSLTFNFIRDVAPVASLIRVPNVLVVNPLVPARSVPEFIGYARANAGKLNMASAGNGSTQHVSGELFKMMTGIDMLHVPYRGSAPALTDMLGGQVHVIFDNMPSSIEYIKTGRLRALAVTTAMRSDALPDVPALSDFLPGYESSAWGGLGAPKGTPTEIVGKLNRELNAALADPTIKARLAELGATVFASSSDAFGTFIREETEKWAKVVQFAGIKPD
jgi:tripartite-type tricarboxylate transporter receptor subunit TctC